MGLGFLYLEFNKLEYCDKLDNSSQSENLECEKYV